MYDHITLYYTYWSKFMFPERGNQLRMIIAGTGASVITKVLSANERFLVCTEYVCQTLPVNNIYTAVIYFTFIFVKLFEYVGRALYNMISLFIHKQ